MTLFKTAATAALFFATTAIADPVYTDTDELVLPQGIETWVFVGTNLGLGYIGEPAVMPATFHNVYMETQAYLSFMESGEFEDKTMFAIEVRATKDKVADGVINAGVYNADLIAVEVSVKDAERPTRPGSEAIWAYYNFGSPDGIKKTAPAEDDATCFDCHAVHAGYDHVWTQLYPRLLARLGDKSKQ